MIRSFARSSLAALLLATALTACGAARTAPATQPSPAAFEVQKSDAKAIELADQVIAAAGGEAAWNKARFISWDQKIAIDDRALEGHHDWDRWEGRHRGVALMNGVEAVAVYEQFGSLAFATFDGEQVSTADVPRLVNEAKKRLAIDAYMLLMPFKLKDPGVVLKYVGEKAEEATPDVATLEVIKVSFEPGVGPMPGNVYYVNIKKADHLISSIELIEEGKTEEQRIGYRFEDWTEVAGLKLSLKRQNIGHAGEVWTFANVKIAEEAPEELFIKELR